MARRTRTSKSEITRRAIEAYAEDEEVPPKGSLADLAADIIGSVEGPGDLSYNKKHMEGFGR